MITLLLGTNNLAKKQHIKLAAKQREADVELFTENSSIPVLAQLFEQQLFGAPKVVVFDHAWKQLDPEQLLENFADNNNATVFIVEESLDKRKKVNVEFQKDKRVTVIQNDSPIGTKAASDWVLNYAKQNNFNIEPAASLALARALLVDEDSSLDVMRAQNELEKLKQYSAEDLITEKAVELLVEPITGVDVFELLNAIATKNRKQALSLLQNYFATETADEKANAIKVVALLSDQFRSLLIALDFTARHLPDAEILKLTGWKSGRLFIMKKLSKNFSIKQVSSALAKLGNLDRELKTGSMPPHVVLDLIIADI